MEVLHNDLMHLSNREFASWPFEPTGDYISDRAKGRALARELLARRDESNFNPMLGWIVQSVGKLDRDLSALEIGFFSDLSRALVGNDLAPPAPNLRVINGGADKTPIEDLDA